MRPYLILITFAFTGCGSSNSPTDQIVKQEVIRSDAAKEPTVPQPSLDQKIKSPREQLMDLVNFLKKKEAIVELVEAKYSFDIKEAQREYGAVKSINGSEVMISWRGNEFGVPCIIFKMYHMGFRNFNFNAATNTAEVIFRDDKAFTSRYDAKSYATGQYESPHQIQGEMKVSLYFENKTWAVDKIECKNNALKSTADQVALLENSLLQKKVNDMCLKVMSNL